MTGFRNLEDDARVWFLQVQHAEGTPAWRRFTELLHLRFKSPPCPNLLHQVSFRVDNALRILVDVSTTQLDRLRARLQAKDKEEHERRAVIRRQAAARGLLARRRAQAFHATKASKEQAAVRLQAAVRGFLVRRRVRMRRMFLIPARWQITAGWFDYSSSPVLPCLVSSGNNHGNAATHHQRFNPCHELQRPSHLFRRPADSLAAISSSFQPTRR